MHTAIPAAEAEAGGLQVLVHLGHIASSRPASDMRAYLNKHTPELLELQLCYLNIANNFKPKKKKIP